MLRSVYKHIIMAQTFKTRLKALPFNRKVVLFGSALGILSVVMPWYSDIDRFGVGDQFLGITGPLYLAGLLVLVSGGLSFAYLMMKIAGKRTPVLPLEEGHFHIGNGALSLFMILMASSVYFHDKFGVSLVDKQAGFGMLLALFAGVTITVGGILITRSNEEIGSFEEEIDDHMEPLIDLNQRSQGDIMDREMTVEEAIQESETKVWGQVEESINQFQPHADDTKDIQ